LLLDLRQQKFALTIFHSAAIALGKNRLQPTDVCNLWGIRLDQWVLKLWYVYH